MSSNIDPLVNSRIRNKLLLSDAQSYLPTGTTGNSADDIDNILDKTTIKRACCSNTSNVNVKLPIYPNISFDEFTGGGVIEQKFGFINKTINVPTSSCPTGYDTGTEMGSSCNTFYRLYCANSRKVYKDKKTSLGENLDLNEFKLYSPDCASIDIERDWPSVSSSSTISIEIANLTDVIYVSSAISDIITNVIMTTATNCSGSSSTNVSQQVINIQAAGDVDISVTNNTTNTFSLSCLQGSTMTSLITDALTSAISNAINSTYTTGASTDLSEALSAAVSVSDTNSVTNVNNTTQANVISYVQNLVESNITQESVTSFLTGVTTNVNQLVSGVSAGGNATISLSNSAITAAVLSAVQNSSSVSSLANALATSVVSEFISEAATTVSLINAQTTNTDMETQETESTWETGSTWETQETQETESTWETGSTWETQETQETQESPVVPITYNKDNSVDEEEDKYAEEITNEGVFSTNNTSSTVIIIIVAIVLILILIVVFIIIFLSSSKNKSKQIGGSFINNNLFNLKNWLSQII